jgi:hypothetical protein
MFLGACGLVLDRVDFLVGIATFTLEELKYTDEESRPHVGWLDHFGKLCAQDQTRFFL